MKGLFPQYEEASQRDFSRVWEEALFVFDTNVLLNLYRYRSATRDELLNVLTKLSKRVWIPHQVALEFQRNRLSVIAEQNRRFSEVEKTIKDSQTSLIGALDALQLQKRHSLINPQRLIDGFSKLVEAFLQELTELKKAQQKLTDVDPLKERIEAIFDGRVGPPPESQAWIDALFKEAEERFKKRLPPGFEDAIKAKTGDDLHYDDGIVYQKRYGDYVVWRQLLDHVKATNRRSVIYVTDDNKADWWLIVDENGPKTIGPRTELVDEARLFAGVDAFLMYKPEGFLNYAKDFLEASVSEETLREVRDVSTVKQPISSRPIFEMQRFTRERLSLITEGVKSWLLNRFDSVVESPTFPDLIALKGRYIYGFEIWVTSESTHWYRRLREVIKRASESIESTPFHELSIVIVLEDVSILDEAKKAISRIAIDDVPPNLRVVFGAIDFSQSPSGSFIPYEDQLMVNYLL